MIRRRRMCLDREHRFTTIELLVPEGFKGHDMEQFLEAEKRRWSFIKSLKALIAEQL